jgi:predicted small metal-binding protein
LQSALLNLCLSCCGTLVKQCASHLDAFEEEEYVDKAKLKRRVGYGVMDVV